MFVFCGYVFACGPQDVEHVGVMATQCVQSSSAKAISDRLLSKFW